LSKIGLEGVKRERNGTFPVIILILEGNPEKGRGGGIVWKREI